MKNERAARNAKEGLWNLFRQGMQPRCQTAGEYGNRQHRQDRTTLVPSKSKRKRTSSRPASIIACRHRLRSLAQNIRKPPPPAPTSLPPIAPFFIASEYHPSICWLLMASERRFLYSQCSCINSPNRTRSPDSKASLLR